MGDRRFALRQLFVLVAIAALCCAAVKFTGIWASILLGVALVWIVGMAIVALVDRGARQAYAIGFSVAALVYLTTLFLSADAELDPYTGVLPTTKLLRFVYQLVVEETYIDMASGKAILNYDPSKPPGGGMSGGGVGLSEFPQRRPFMTVGHIVWTLVLGCIGGFFGRLTYAQRQRSCSPSNDKDA